MKKRIFSAEKKATIVIEVLRGEKGINEIATENEIAPNQIRNWKRSCPQLRGTLEIIEILRIAPKS